MSFPNVDSLIINSLMQISQIVENYDIFLRIIQTITKLNHLYLLCCVWQVVGVKEWIHSIETSKLHSLALLVALIALISLNIVLSNPSHLINFIQ